MKTPPDAPRSSRRALTVRSAPGELDPAPSVTRLAVVNPTNFLFLAGVAAVGAIGFATYGLLPLAVGLGLEALWVLVIARGGGPRRYFEFLRMEHERRRGALDEQAMLRTLGEDDRRRFLEIRGIQEDIERQVASNPSLAMNLVGAELDKLEQLARTFLVMANGSARYESYASGHDQGAIEAEVRRQETLVEKAADADQRRLAEQNLVLLKKRLDKASEMRRHIRNLRGQLNLIENTFRLLRDQIVTMSSPKELTGQIAELTAAIDTIEMSALETDAIVRRLDREIEGLGGRRSE